MNNKSKVIGILISLSAIAFGVMTIKSGSFALFGGEEGKLFAGKYLPIVLWFNFIAGFFYVISGLGLLMRKCWALTLAKTITVLTLIIFVIFGINIVLEVPYEMRTVGAMSVRTIFWFITSLYFSKFGGSRCIKKA